MTKPQKFKVGQCIRLRKYRNAGLAGAAAEAYMKLHGQPALPREPTYVYLKITEVGKVEAPHSLKTLFDDQPVLYGDDLIRLDRRAFKMSGIGNWVEFDPTPERKIVDFWGYDEVRLLEKEHVRIVVRDYRKKLRKKAALAQETARKYEIETREILAKL